MGKVWAGVSASVRLSVCISLSVSISVCLCDRVHICACVPCSAHTALFNTCPLTVTWDLVHGDVGDGEPEPGRVVRVLLVGRRHDRNGHQTVRKAEVSLPAGTVLQDNLSATQNHQHCHHLYHYHRISKGLEDIYFLSRLSE